MGSGGGTPLTVSDSSAVVGLYGRRPIIFFICILLSFSSRSVWWRYGGGGSFFVEVFLREQSVVAEGEKGDWWVV